MNLHIWNSLNLVPLRLDRESRIYRLYYTNRHKPIRMDTEVIESIIVGQLSLSRLYFERGDWVLIRTGICRLLTNTRTNRRLHSL